MSRRLPPLLALRAFESAGRLLSFTLASQELHRTQGAISRQVRQLEEFLGQKLFVRLTRRVELTEVGKEYLKAIQQILADVESATQKCRSQDRPVLTIDVLPTLGSCWLMPRLTRFNEQHPEVDIRIVSSIEPVNMHSKDIDLAIRVGRLPGRHYDARSPRVDLEMTTEWRGVEAYPLFGDVMVPVISPELAKRHGPIVQAKDLLELRLINNTSRKNAWQDWFAFQGVQYEETAPRLDYGHFFMALQAAREGRGVALIPSVIFNCLREAGELICPLDTRVSSAAEYYLLTKSTNETSPPVAAMKSWLLEEAASCTANMQSKGFLCEAAGGAAQFNSHELNPQPQVFLHADA